MKTIKKSKLTRKAQAGTVLPTTKSDSILKTRKPDITKTAITTIGGGDTAKVRKDYNTAVTPIVKKATDVGLSTKSVQSDLDKRIAAKKAASTPVKRNGGKLTKNKTKK